MALLVDKRSSVGGYIPDSPAAPNRKAGLDFCAINPPSFDLCVQKSEAPLGS
ncbi:hypothetical protein PGTUg99_011418 [Puccinia graminis f. sp. tritici]|uniref:Uncharacterized protein n=1 Tax=Puccinia graminis f. sp. tritici TaxID=56615 RepID=A0A5B0R8N9_PUCGR|nr:hypothetical protein PGTUg99_011418 [Puccinia graminis f. sp. tritici]